jgi:CoA:oxalate CoA-transferase
MTQNTDAGYPFANSGSLLDGVVVIEHAKGVAGSYAGKLLAMMGATVIKIEDPKGGDNLRREYPLLNVASHLSSLFTYLNVNKASVTLDCLNSLGGKVLVEMLDRADLFIDDTPLDTRDGSTVDVTRLRDACPNLVYLSVLPFGAVGPHSRFVASELNLFHSGGEGYLLPNGLALDLFPDRPPIKAYGHVGEFQGGISAAIAGVAALLAVPSVGGQFVDVSVQDANVALSAMNLQRFGDGVLENRPIRSFTYGGVLPCRDGYVEILVIQQRHWETLREMLGSPAWCMDPELDDHVARGARGKEINEHLRAWSADQDADDIVALARQHGVPLGKFYSTRDVLESEHELARGFIQTLSMDDGTEISMPSMPFRVSHATQATINYLAEVPGQDTDAVLGEWLGHTRDELIRWHAEGVT